MLIDGSTDSRLPWLQPCMDLHRPEDWVRQEIQRSRGPAAVGTSKICQVAAGVPIETHDFTCTFTCIYGDSDSMRYEI